MNRKRGRLSRAGAIGQISLPSQQTSMHAASLWRHGRGRAGYAALSTAQAAATHRTGGCSYQTSWIIPISPSDRIGARFYTHTVPATTHMWPNRPAPAPVGLRCGPAGPRFFALTQRPAAPAGAALPAGRGPESASSSVRPPWRGAVGDRAGGCVCRRAIAAALTPRVTTYAGGRNENTRASTPGAASSALPPGLSTRCGEGGLPRFAAASFLRRSTNALFSRPLRPSLISAAFRASHVPQRITRVTRTRRRHR